MRFRKRPYNVSVREPSFRNLSPEKPRKRFEWWKKFTGSLRGTIDTHRVLYRQRGVKLRRSANLLRKWFAWKWLWLYTSPRWNRMRSGLKSLFVETYQRVIKEVAPGLKKSAVKGKKVQRYYIPLALLFTGSLLLWWWLTKAIASVDISEALSGFWREYWIVIVTILVITLVIWVLSNAKRRSTASGAMSVKWLKPVAGVTIVLLLAFWLWPEDGFNGSESATHDTTTEAVRQPVSPTACGTTRSPSDSVKFVTVTQAGVRQGGLHRYTSYWEPVGGPQDYVVRYPKESGAVDSVIYRASDTTLKVMSIHPEWIELASTTAIPIEMKIVLCL